MTKPLCSLLLTANSAEPLNWAKSTYFGNKVQKLFFNLLILIYLFFSNFRIIPNTHSKVMSQQRQVNTSNVLIVPPFQDTYII